MFAISRRCGRSSWALGVWSVGVFLSGVPVLLGMLSLRRVARESTPVTDQAMLRLARRLAARIGLRRPVRLVLSPRREIPMTWGVLRPVILLPADAAGWSEERLTMALLHELAHVKRWDCLTQLVARAACAVYWFNPLSWLALARVRREQEQACRRPGAAGAGSTGTRTPITCWRSSPVEPRAGPARPWRWRWRRPRSWSAGCAASSTRAGAVARSGRRTIGLVTARRVGPPPAPGGPQPAGRGRSRSPKQVVVAPAEPPRGETAKPKPDAADAVESEVLAKVREVYVKPPDESALRKGAIKGILDALHDPYSAYFDAQQMADLDRNLQGKVTGIGAQLELKDGNVTVVTPLPDSPAIKAGHQARRRHRGGRRSSRPGGSSSPRWSSESSARRARWCGSR